MRFRSSSTSCRRESSSVPYGHRASRSAGPQNAPQASAPQGWPLLGKDTPKKSWKWDTGAGGCVETKQRCNAPGDSAVARAPAAWQGLPALQSPVQSSSSGSWVGAGAEVLVVVFNQAGTRAVTRVPAALFEAPVCWATLTLVGRVHQLKQRCVEKQQSNIALAGVIRYGAIAERLRVCGRNRVTGLAERSTEVVVLMLSFSNRERSAIFFLI